MSPSEEHAFPKVAPLKPMALATYVTATNVSYVRAMLMPALQKSQVSQEDPLCPASSHALFPYVLFFLLLPPRRDMLTFCSCQYGPHMPHSSPPVICFAVPLANPFPINNLWRLRLTPQAGKSQSIWDEASSFPTCWLHTVPEGTYCIQTLTVGNFCGTGE